MLAGGRAAVGGSAGGGVGGGAAGGSCGGVACGGSGCGEGAEVISWVGNGQGSYIQETSYKYVGYGAGEFETVQVGGGYKWCMCIGGGIGLLLLVGLLVWLLLPGEPDTSSTTPLPFDCNAGFANWQNGWTPAKRAWCCRNTGRGCPSTAPAPITTIAPAPITTIAPAPITTKPNPCNEGGVSSWTAEKRAYCCEHYQNGCPTAAPTPAPTPAPVPYDCDAGFANWQAGWSVGKKQWCCQHTGRGCPVTTGGCVSDPYDCEAGFANWQAGWSLEKKAWCCKNKGKGCPPAAGGCA